jgi:hypothetical protein
VKDYSVRLLPALDPLLLGLALSSFGTSDEEVKSIDAFVELLAAELAQSPGEQFEFIWMWVWVDVCACVRVCK